MNLRSLMNFNDSSHQFLWIWDTFFRPRLGVSAYRTVEPLWCTATGISGSRAKLGYLGSSMSVVGDHLIPSSSSLVTGTAPPNCRCVGFFKHLGRHFTWRKTDFQWDIIYIYIWDKTSRNIFTFTVAVRVCTLLDVLGGLRLILFRFFGVSSSNRWHGQQWLSGNFPAMFDDSARRGRVSPSLIVVCIVVSLYLV